MTWVKDFADYFSVDLYAILSGAEFFRGISERSLRSLAAACIPKRVDKRVLLFHEGQEGDSLYILAEGIVQLYKSAEDGREVVLRTLKAGEIFGEVVLFESGRYPASAVTLSPCVLLRLTRLQVDCLLAEGEFRADFIAMLMRKQRYLAERILYLTTRDVEDRFFDFLAEQYGRRETYRPPVEQEARGRGHRHDPGDLLPPAAAPQGGGHRQLGGRAPVAGARLLAAPRAEGPMRA